MATGSAFHAASAVPLPLAPRALRAAYFSRRQGMAMTLGVAATIWVVDLCTANINLSILYTLAILLYARSASRPHFWRIMAVVVFLTYSGYLLGPRVESLRTTRQLLSDHRMLNRTFAIAAAAAVAWTVILSRRVDERLRARRRETLPPDAEQNVYDEVVRAFEHVTAIIIVASLTIAITAADLLSPSQINLPILYAVPLAACLWTRRPGLVWVLLPLLLCVTMAGYRWGPPADSDLSIPAVLRNRAIAAVVIIVVAIGVHYWQRADARRLALAVADDTAAGAGPNPDEIPSSHAALRETN